MKHWLTRLRQTWLSSDVDKEDEFDARVYGDEQFAGRSDDVYVNYGNIIVNLLSPGTFVDVGCANGFLPHHLRSLGIEAYGIEGAEAAFRHMPEDIKPVVCRRDLREPWGELPFRTQTFDVVNFTEVAEHLKKEHEDQMLHNVLGLVSDILVISWSDQWDEYRGTDRQEHFNPRSKRYVRRRLSGLGMRFCKDLTRSLNDDLNRAHVYEHWQNRVLVFRKA